MNPPVMQAVFFQVVMAHDGWVSCRVRGCYSILVMKSFCAGEDLARMKMSSVLLGFSLRWGEDIQKETLFDRKQTHCLALWHGHAGPTSDTDLTETEASEFIGELNKTAGATGHWVVKLVHRRHPWTETHWELR